jgi:O-succinylbenzoate synthase
MRIEEISVFHVAMPLIDPWKTAFGEMREVDTVLVRMRSEGETGWGECAPYAQPNFSSEWAQGCFSLITSIFRPLLLGQEITSAHDLQDRLSPFKGNHFAKAAVDLAWWDLSTRLHNRPLWQMIGGQDRTISVGADIPVQLDRNRLIHLVAAALDAGYPRVKLKYRRDSGVEMVACVREAFPEAVIHIDCNSGFSLNDVAEFRALDRLRLAMIEQPLASDDLIDHARLQGELETPLCLDESITSVDRARKAIDTGAARIINIKHGRVGGLTNAVEIARLCHQRGIPFWIGGMLESAVGQGPSMALATLPGVGYPADIFPNGRLYSHELSWPPIKLSAPGQMTVSDDKGCGYRPEFATLKARLRQSMEDRDLQGETLA